MTGGPSRESLGQHVFSDAGRIARSDNLLRRELDGAVSKDTWAGGAGRNVPTSPRDAKAAKKLRQRGLQLLRAGREAEAIGILRKAALSDTEDPDTHYALGTALLQAGQFAAAASSLTQAIAFKPDFAIAHRDLGTAFDLQGLDVEAVRAFQRALALSPKLPGVHHRLAELYEARGGSEEAIACYEQAAAAAPDTTAGRLCRIKALLLGRNVKAAELLLRKAIALDPTSGDAHATLAGLLVTEGRMMEGAEHYDRSLQLNPRLAGSWNGIVRTKKFTSADQPVVERMKAALATDRLDDQERMALHFALGKVYDDFHEYAEAMRHFDAANLIRNRSIKFDRAALAAWADRLIER
ncbi:MAG: tetratricopeptide repeat protein, partial [Acetobacteraceae bacterium]